MELNIDETKGDGIHEVMGITEERVRELFELAKVQLLNGDTHTSAFGAICTECKNLEEVVYVIYRYGVTKAKLDAVVESDDLMMQALRIAGHDRITAAAQTLQQDTKTNTKNDPKNDRKTS